MAKKQNKIVIDNFLGGISQSDRLGTLGSYSVGRAVNPLSRDNYGYLCPGGAFTTITNTMTQINAFALDEQNAKGYALVKGTKLYKLDSDGMDMIDGTGFPHTIAHTGSGTIIGEDCKIYPVGTTHYLFYSYNGFTDTSSTVGRATLTGAAADATFDDDFMCKEPSGCDTFQTSYPHPMMEWGENGFLYIADGRYLHQFDGQTGANGTVTAEKLTLPYGWVITSLFDAGDYIGLTAQYTTSTTWSYTGRKTISRVFFWDGISETYNKRVQINDQEIRATKVINGEIYLFTKGDDAHGYIRKWNGTSFVLVAKLPYGVVSGYNSVDVYGDNLIFASYGNGSTTDSGRICILNKEGNIFDISNSTQVNAVYVYALATFGSNVVVGHYSGALTTYYLSYFGPSQTTNANFQYKSLYYEFPQRVRINYVKLYFKKLTSGIGDDVLIEYDYDKGSKHIGNISYAGDGAIASKRISADIDCNNFRLVIQKDEGAGIRYGKIIIDYTPVADI